MTYLPLVMGLFLISYMACKNTYIKNLLYYLLVCLVMVLIYLFNGQNLDIALIGIFFTVTIEKIVMLNTKRISFISLKSSRQINALKGITLLVFSLFLGQLLMGEFSIFPFITQKLEKSNSLGASVSGGSLFFLVGIYYFLRSKPWKA